MLSCSVRVGDVAGQHARVAWNRSSSSLPFQAFQTRGLVPRMSATVSRYSAVSRRSVPTLRAKAAITSGSVRSCFCAVDDIDQMVGDQPRDQFGVLVRQPVVAAEAPRVARAERRVIAAAALGDVVEQAGEVEHLAPLEIGDEPRAQRILVRMLRLGEAAQVADHHQDVLVHRVDVEQVVLHLADDAAERRQVLAEDAVQVHPPQLVQQAALGAEHRHEARAIGGIAAEGAVDAVAVAPQRAQRARRHALELAVLLQHQERVEHRRRAA